MEFCIAISKPRDNIKFRINKEYSNLTLVYEQVKSRKTEEKEKNKAKNILKIPYQLQTLFPTKWNAFSGWYDRLNDLIRFDKI